MSLIDGGDESRVYCVEIQLLPTSTLLNNNHCFTAVKHTNTVKLELSY